MLHEVRVWNTSKDTRGEEVLAEIHSVLDITSIKAVTTTRVYRLEGVTQAEAETLARELLCDPITQQYQLAEQNNQNGHTRIEVAYKPGVMNPEAASILKAARDRGLTSLVAVDSSTEYQFVGTPEAEEVEQITSRLLVNKTVQTVVETKPSTLLITDSPGTTQIVPLGLLSEAELEDLSKTRSLFLNLAEMQVIQSHFREIEQREPLDAELETLAQTWSEHCGHKTFKARLIVNGQEKPPLIEQLMSTARQYSRGVLSSFVDNSGVIEFYDGWAICGKVETHNSPSAIEPYGGANTGLGGVVRDPLGTGLGAKVIASTNMFCLVPPNLPADQLPEGCLPPRYLFQNVVRGVRDYGNRMGIPTANGSVHFHPDFRAKPSVIVGAYGILPVATCQKGEPRPGDMVIAVGGRTGRDGIHGATFSSGEMTAQTISVNSSAVQIGNAIEEKRMADAILQCRDEGLIEAITDCGAGGFASAMGEMGSKTGVEVWLEKAPLKYSGLAPWEILLSESQERMVIAVSALNAPAVITICSNLNVEATVVGTFTNNQRFVVTHQDSSVCNLSMEFLHHGLPQRVMVARPRLAIHVNPVSIPEPQTHNDWLHCYQAVLGHGNVCSKEPIVRMYDHSVQGTSALPPFTGVHDDGPNDATIIRPLLDKPYGLVIAHGLNPVLNQIDPYDGSLWAIVEALSNYVAVGGNFRDAALIDNFIWPFPDEESMYDLYQAVQACCAAMETFHIPFVSGKDSLSSTYRRPGFVLKIPPVLDISVFGKIPDVTQTVSSDLKPDGDQIILIGKPDTEHLGGSTYYDIHGHLGNHVPQVHMESLPQRFDWFHQHIVAGDILACHDISEGGILGALAEMCFGGNCGANLQIPPNYQGRTDHWLFNETAGCFLAQIDYANFDKLHQSALASNVPLYMAAQVRRDQGMRIYHHGKTIFTAWVQDLKSAWQQPMKEVFHS